LYPIIAQLGVVEEFVIIWKMNLPLIASIVSTALFVFSMGWYVRDIARGLVKVSVATFAALAVVTASQLAALVAEGSWYQVPFSAVAMTVNITICVLAFRRRTVYFSSLDRFALFGAFFGLVLWYVSGDALLNIYILTVVMLVSVIPIVVKTFKHPSSETKLPWQINLLGSIVLMFTIVSPAPEVWLVPLRQLLFSGVLNIALLRKSSRK